MANRSNSDLQNVLTIYGKNSVLAALSSEHPVQKVIFESRSDKDDRIRAIKDAASRLHVPMDYKVGTWFLKNFGDVPHQGVVAQCAPVHQLDLSELLARAPSKSARRSLVLVNQVTDPHNLGAIIRVVAASGADGLIMTKDKSSPFSSVAVAASAGTAFLLPIATVANLSYAMERLKKEGYWLYGLDASTGTDYRKEKYSQSSAFVLGSEGSGLRELTRKNVDFFVRIPMRSGVESLNVSTALAVVLFRAVEIQR